jgi:hypothetical protein
LQHFAVETGRGRVIISAQTQRPRVLLIHGFKRHFNQVAPWSARIPDLGFVHLPGHSGAPAFEEVSLPAWIEGIGEAVAKLPEPPLILAESLGAIVAMSLPARAVIAVEPPLSTHQLWPLHRTIRSARARGIEIGPELEAMFDQPFTWVLDRIGAPTLMLAGSEPLLPERQTSHEPSLLTDQDFAAYARHPLVEAHRIAGGHTLLDHNPDGVMAASRAFMLRHGYLPASATD